MDMKIYASAGASQVEYSKEAAAVEIDVLIQELQEARADGATHVVGLSGNYRGAKYVRIGSFSIEDPEDDENY